MEIAFWTRNTSKQKKQEEQNECGTTKQKTTEVIQAIDKMKLEKLQGQEDIPPELLEYMG